jgi:hypothetical protein
MKKFEVVADFTKPGSMSSNAFFNGKVVNQGDVLQVTEEEYTSRWMTKPEETKKAESEI